MVDNRRSLCKFNYLWLTGFILFAHLGFAQDGSSSFNSEVNKLFLEKKTKLNTEQIKKESFYTVLVSHLVFGIKHITPDYNLRKESYFAVLDGISLRITKVKAELATSGVSTNIISKLNSTEAELNELIENRRYLQGASSRLEELVSLFEAVKEKIGANQTYDTIEAKINDYFTETSGTLNRVSNNSSSVSDFISEWERVQILSDLVKAERIKVYQKKLIEKANSAQKLVIAKDLFKRALELFNYGKYEQADLVFDELLEQYGFINNKYQIHYYKALSNYYLTRYQMAKESMAFVWSSPKMDELIAFSHLKILISEDNEAEITKILPKLNQIKAYKRTSDDINFILGRYFLEKQKYSLASSYFKKVSSAYNLANDSRYYQAVATYNSNKLEAKTSLIQLASSEDITIDIRNEALIKAAYMTFQEGDYSSALRMYKEINPEGCFEYERVLLGVAWCYYELERSKKTKQDYSRTITLVNEILRNFPDSDYYNEAKSLLGYVKQLSGNYDEASKEYRHVFESKAYVIFSDKLLSELDSLNSVKSEIETLKDKALLKKDNSSFQRLSNIQFDIEKKIFRLKYMDVSSVSQSSNVDLKTVVDQVSEFERLREIALKKGDEDILKRIDYNLLRLYSVVKKYKEGKENSLFGLNYFSDQKLARKLSIQEHQNNKMSNFSSKASRQHSLVNDKLRSLDNEKLKARQENNFKKRIDLDIVSSKLASTEKRIDYVKSASSDFRENKSAANLDKWANYGAYQLTNLQYSQKQRFAEENARTDASIKSINKLISDRNIYLAEQIKQIENNIYVMTRRETRRRRIEERDKTKQFFNTEFFDETKSEVNEDSIRQHLNFLEAQRNEARRKSRAIPDSAQLEADPTIDQAPLKENPLPSGKDENKVESQELEKEEE